LVLPERRFRHLPVTILLQCDCGKSPS